MSSIILTTKLSLVIGFRGRVLGSIDKPSSNLGENRHFALYFGSTEIVSGVLHKNESEFILTSLVTNSRCRKISVGVSPSLSFFLQYIDFLSSFSRSMVIDQILKDHEDQQTRPLLAFFYCTRESSEPRRANPTEIMLSIFKQLSCKDV
jgi:hypothetical protein